MNSTSIEEQASQIHYQPGAYLSQEREKRGISIEQVANTLHLRVQVLKHLEADEYQHLPQEVFVQGYIRGYCKFLSIPADEIIESYLKIKPQASRGERGLWQNSQPNLINDKWMHWISAGLFIVVVGAASMWLFQNKINPPPVVDQWRQSH